MSTWGMTITKPEGHFEMPARWWLSPSGLEVDGPLATDVSVQLKCGECEEGMNPASIRAKETRGRRATVWGCRVWKRPANLRKPTGELRQWWEGDCRGEPASFLYSTFPPSCISSCGSGNNSPPDKQRASCSRLQLSGMTRGQTKVELLFQPQQLGDGEGRPLPPNGALPAQKAKKAQEGSVYNKCHTNLPIGIVSSGG